MQLTSTLFYACALAFAALGVQAADSSVSPPASSVQSNTAASSVSSAAANGTSTSASGSASASATGPANSTATNGTDSGKKNHAFQGAVIDYSVLYGAASVLGGTILGAVTAL